MKISNTTYTNKVLRVYFGAVEIIFEGYLIWLINALNGNGGPVIKRGAYSIKLAKCRKE